MEATQLLAILRRRAWSIVRFMVVAGLVVGIASYLRTPVYRASAQVLLRPNDPSESLDNSNVQPITGTDSGRYANSQAAIVKSPAVAAAAAPDIPGGWNPNQVLDHLSVGVDPNSNVLTIKCTSTDPAQAQQCADKVAHTYIANRTQYEVSRLEQTINDLTANLTSLESEIQHYDDQINKDAASGSGSSSITSPTNPSAASAPKSPTTSPSLPSDGTSTSGDTQNQTLLAQRFAAETQYQQSFAQLQSLKIEKSLKRGEAELVSDAKLPGSPISPKPFRDGALGAIAGLLVGAGVAFLREQLDDKIRSADELESLTGVPVLAQVPLDPEVSAHPDVLAASAHPLGQFAEAIRSLRTSLQFMGVDEPVRSVLVTSAVPGDGKTAIAANLAVVYAQAGFDTVLVSADMRRPRLDSMFPEIELGNGLSGMLTQLAASQRRHRHGEANGNGNGNGNGGAAAAPVDDDIIRAALREHLVSTSIEHLAVLPAGLRAPNPAEVLGSRWMREVMAYLTRECDIVIVDSSPALAVTDAVVLSTIVDGVVLVVPSDEVSRGDVQRAVKTFETVDTRVLGTILNRNASVGRQYYYYGYHGPAPDAKPAWRRRDRGRAKAAASDEALSS